MKRAFPLLLASLAACSAGGKLPIAVAPAPSAAPAPPAMNAARPRPEPAPMAGPSVEMPVAIKPVSGPDQPPPRPFPPTADCQIHGRGDWTAHIDAMPGPNARPRLIVTGTVASKPAARLELRLDPAVLESDPPQRVVNLIVRLPTEPTIDSLVRREVRGEWPVTPPLGAVHIRCGGRSVASITDILVAH